MDRQPGRDLDIDGDRVTNDWRVNSSGRPVEAMTEGLATYGIGQPPR